MKYFNAVLHHMKRIAGFDADCEAETRADLDALETTIDNLERRLVALERLDRQELAGRMGVERVDPGGHGAGPRVSDRIAPMSRSDWEG